MSLQTFYKNNTVPLTLLLLILGALLLSMLIASQRTQAYKSTVQNQLSIQEELLHNLATETAQNRATSPVGTLVTDCPREQRIAFDILLGQIDDGLQRSELLELDQLFGSCADVLATRKAVLVSHLKREIEVFDNYLTQLSTLTRTAIDDDYQLELWQTLLNHEETQQRGFAELVSAQKQIIDSLITGQAADSKDIMAILDSVAETRESLQFANTQATSLRAELGNT